MAQIPTMQLPNYFVMKSLADFAHSYPSKFIPYLKTIMTKILPLLSLVKQDNMKWIFAVSFGRFAEAILQCSVEPEPNPAYAVSEFAATMNTALNIVHTEWVNARELRVRAAACEALGNLASIVDEDVLCTNFVKIVTTLMAVLKREKSKDQLPIIQGLHSLL